MSSKESIRVPEDEIDPRYPTGYSPKQWAARQALRDRPLAHLEHFMIEIGGKSPRDYETELQNEGFRLSVLARELLTEITVAKERQTLDLVRLTVSDLGFKDATRHDQICARAEELGLERCPAEVGPALRLAMKDQPMNDWIIVAMEPLAARDGDLKVFYVARQGGGSWLEANYGGPDNAWSPGGSFAFVARKTQRF